MWSARCRSMSDDSQLGHGGGRGAKGGLAPEAMPPRWSFLQGTPITRSLVFSTVRSDQAAPFWRCLDFSKERNSNFRLLTWFPIKQPPCRRNNRCAGMGSPLTAKPIMKAVFQGRKVRCACLTRAPAAPHQRDVTRRAPLGAGGPSATACGRQAPPPRPHRPGRPRCTQRSCCWSPQMWRPRSGPNTPGSTSSIARYPSSTSSRHGTQSGRGGRVGGRAPKG
jgi:hypothetical protein